MISKQLFTLVIEAIIAQNKTDREVSKSLEKVCDGWVGLNTKNEIYNTLHRILKDIFDDKDDWIGWWLYEDVKKEIKVNGKNVSLKTVFQLYDFLVKNKL